MAYFDIEKKWLEHEKIVRKWKRFGEIFFVNRDSTKGSNSNHGKSPDSPLLDINAAVAKCTDYNNDYIVFSGRLTSGQQFSEQQVIDVDGVHLIGASRFFGMGGGYADSCFVTPHTCGSILDGDANDFKCGLVLGADGIEVAGIRFYNPDATQAQFHIGLLDNQGNGRNCSIHDCQFQGQTAGTASRTSGVKAVGVETLHVFRNHFYACETGIEIKGGAKRYATENILQGNIISKPKYGINLSGGSTTENEIIENMITQKGTYGYAMTAGINVHNDASKNNFLHNWVFHGTKGTAFSPGTGTNYWILNYYSDSGGTLYDGT